MKQKAIEANRLTKDDLVRCVPYWAVYLSCIAIFFVGWTTTALLIALFSYLIRMFAITAFYHRYFSHKTFRAGRITQFVFALIGASAGQRGPLWWAAHHRNHHRSSDKASDPHSPVQHGFWWSHMLWFVSAKNFPTHYNRVSDFSRYPELRFLDRYDLLMPALYGAAIFGVGVAIETYLPGLETTAWQVLVWGFFVSTVLLHQATFLVNSLAHLIGKRPYPTQDHSRNNVFVAIVTLGEGWHNNHHYYPAATRQGFTWWQIDLTYWALSAMSRLGLVSDLTPVPERIVALGRSK